MIANKPAEKTSNRARIVQPRLIPPDLILPKGFREELVKRVSDIRT